jgi:hypothetical protein
MVAAWWAYSWVDSSARMKVTVPGIATVDPVVVSTRLLVTLLVDGHGCIGTVC